MQVKLPFKDTKNWCRNHCYKTIYGHNLQPGVDKPLYLLHVNFNVVCMHLFRFWVTAVKYVQVLDHWPINLQHILNHLILNIK
jgi:hypothetical protein